MKINTKYFGDIIVDKDEIIFFKEGLPGFPDETEFIIINIEENEMMHVFQSVKNEQLAFIISNPHYFYKTYEFKLDDSIIDLLQLSSEEEVMIYSILTVKSPFETSTINLKAPLVINREKKLGKQFIINDDTYSLKASITPDTDPNQKGD